jgi:hypothetical protein
MVKELTLLQTKMFTLDFIKTVNLMVTDNINGEKVQFL